MLVKALMGAALVGLVGFSIQAGTGKGSADCPSLVSAFVEHPSERRLRDLGTANHDACWSQIVTSESDLTRLLEATRKGNQWTAILVAPRVHTLDGGNLEDALRSLGEFADHKMKRFLCMMKDGTLSNSHATEAIAMLPLALTDDTKAQIGLLKSRQHKVKRMNREDLAPQRSVALMAVNAAVAELERM